MSPDLLTELAESLEDLESDDRRLADEDESAASYYLGGASRLKLAAEMVRRMRDRGLQTTMSRNV